MRAAALLAQLQSLNIEIWVEGDRLRYSAPQGVLTAELRDQIVAHKPELLALLSAAQPTPPDAAVRLQPIERKGALPLSFAQERLWFLTQLDPSSSFYNDSVALRLRGALHQDALVQSCQELVQRHEVLRMKVVKLNGQPVQVIAPEIDIPFVVRDFRNLPDSMHTAEMRQAIMVEVQRPFDLTTAPLIRAMLLQLADDDHVFVLTLHHIVTDAWSWNVLAHELAAFYAALTQGESVNLPPLDVQYGDFVQWQRQALQGEVLESLRAYWNAQLAGAPPFFTLPTDRPRPPVQSFRGARQILELDKELTGTLKTLGIRHGATLFMTLLAAFKALLTHYSGHEDIVIGTRTAGRNRVQLEDLIGFFINTLVLRTQLNGNPSFGALLLRVRETTRAAYIHQDLPFEKLVELLHPQRNPSYQPFINIMFVLQSTPPLVFELSGLEIERLAIENPTAKYDLDFSWIEIDGRLIGTLDYNSDLFEAAMIRTFLRHYRLLLDIFVADPERSILDIMLDLPTERQQTQHIHTDMEQNAPRPEDDLKEPSETHVDRSTFAPSGGQKQSQAVAPRSQSEIEQIIAKSWRETLLLETVGLDDNFFDIGGHSLLMAQVHTDLEVALNCEIPITDLFEYPTISDLSSYLYRLISGTFAEQPMSVAAYHDKGFSDEPGNAIAIIGMAGRFPQAKNLETFWQNLRDGVEARTVFSDEELIAAGVNPTKLSDSQYVKAGMILADIEMFDAAFFGMSPREAEITDPQQRLFLECAWEALEHAGYNAYGLVDHRVGVYAGASRSSYLISTLNFDRDLFASINRIQLSTGNEKDYLTTRISYKLNLRGPSVTVQTACSTSLVAVHLACESLLHGHCDMALAGGVSVSVPQKSGYAYQEGGILSPDGHCRAFDANAQGTIFGDGVGVVLLKRLDNALADGDTIHAVIKGSAINNDGAIKVGYTAPGVDGQAQVITEALAMAEVNPETIGYVEAHGTGTPLGDPIEVLALTKAFRAGTDHTGFCALGSVKTNIGHLETAAGVAGLIKTVLALKHQQLLPSLNFTQPNPRIDFAASPFYVNTTLRPWPASPNGQPRRAGVSAFGFGGTNAHVILEEAPPVPLPAPMTDGPQLLVLSARSETALDTATAQLQAALAAQPDLALTDVAWTLQQGRTPLAYRRTVVVHDATEAVAALATPSRWTTAYQDGPAPRVAFLLPGQGAALGILVPTLYAQQPVFRQHLDALCHQLLPLLDRDLRALLLPAPADADAAAAALQATALQQPALFAVQYALAQLWQAWGVRAQALLGHSLGELVAATLAGVFTLADALALVVRRGQLMQATAPGALLAVALDETAVQPYLSPTVALAAVNGPHQCVLSGPTDTITTLAEQLTADGHEVRRLPGTVAFHSALMEPVQTAFTAAVAAVPRRAPQLPVLSNVTGSWLTAAQATDPAYWGQHLRATVRFADGLATLLADNAPFMLLEFGPGRTLSSLARHHPAVRTDQIVSAGRHPQEATTDTAALLGALGRLWLAGVSIDWAAVHHHAPRRRVPLPTYPFERQRFWLLPEQLNHQGNTTVHSKAETRSGVEEWSYVPSWTRTPQLPPPAPGSLAVPGGWLLLLDDSALSAQLATQLTAQAPHVVCVRPGAAFAQLSPSSYTLRPDQLSDYHALLQALATHGPLPTQLVLVALPPTTEQSVPGWTALLACSQALAAWSDLPSLQLTLVTQGGVAVESTDRLALQAAPLRALALVLPHEVPTLACRWLDLPVHDPRPLAVLAQQVLAELVAPPVAAVAYRGTHRWLPQLTPAPLPPVVAPPPATPPTYLLAGRLDDLGLRAALALARTTPTRWAVLIPPTWPLPAQWGTWRATHPADDPQAGALAQLELLAHVAADLVIVPADLQDPATLAPALAEIHARCGALAAVCYAPPALTLPPFCPLPEVVPAAVQAGLHTLTEEVTALAAALATYPPAPWVLHGTLAAVRGGVGQLPLAVVGLALDVVVNQSGQAGTAPWSTIAWDRWADTVNDDPALGLNESDGGQLFQRLLHHVPGPQLVVTPADLQTIRMRSRRGKALQEDTTLNGSYARPTLTTAYAAPRSEVEEAIAAIWQQALGIAQVGLDDNFFDLGGDSLIAVQAVAEIKRVLDRQIPAVSMYQRPTIRSLADLIQQDEASADYERTARLVERKEASNRRKQQQQQRRQERLSRGAESHE